MPWSDWVPDDRGLDVRLFTAALLFLAVVGMAMP
jgi:hypothetical protein